MRVLIGCESSGRVREEFKKRGHDAWSCDLSPTEIPGQHLQCDVRDVLRDGWDVGIFHPPCTYLATSGSRWFFENPSDWPGSKAVMGDARWAALAEGIDLFLDCLNAPIPHKALENPIPHTWAMKKLPRWNQIIQPWYFGDEQTKGTCLWLVGLPRLLPTNPRTPPLDLEARKAWQCVWREPPGPDQAKNRSRTFPGIAEAMADQWGTIPDPTSLDSLLWQGSRTA